MSVKPKVQPPKTKGNDVGNSLSNIVWIIKDKSIVSGNNSKLEGKKFEIISNQEGKEDLKEKGMNEIIKNEKVF